MLWLLCLVLCVLRDIDSPLASHHNLIATVPQRYISHDNLVDVPRLFQEKAIVLFELEIDDHIDIATSLAHGNNLSV